MEFQEVIKKRKTTKEYELKNQISDDEIKQLIEAAWEAPTPSNLQNNRIIVLKSNDAKKEYTKHFHDFNQKIVQNAEVIFLFVGIPWDEVRENKGQWIYDVDVRFYDQTEEAKRGIVDWALNYYDNISEFAPIGDIYTSAIWFSFMQLKATDLGLGSTPMLGFDKTAIEKQLRDSKLITNKERVNLSLAVGYPKPNSIKNDRHNERIRENINDMYKEI